MLIPEPQHLHHYPRVTVLTLHGNTSNQVDAAIQATHIPTQLGEFKSLPPVLHSSAPLLLSPPHPALRQKQNRQTYICRSDLYMQKWVYLWCQIWLNSHASVTVYSTKKRNNNNITTQHPKKPWETRETFSFSSLTVALSYFWTGWRDKQHLWMAYCIQSTMCI